ncbi:MAG: DUF2652 domain-containing protein [Bacteroidetes bacterium]|nr:DUF2652 domain-containing protein [Bacteroidota bacterium]
MVHIPDTILLIADISGYTKFMKQHTISVSHAKQIIVRLLKSIMQASKPPLKVVELEGDAVFFYARASGGVVSTVAEDIKSQIVEFFKAFKSELAQINALKTCPCDACEHVLQLQLKQVVHAGNVEVEHIEHFEKLFGFDVILVHKLLKNSIPAHEYVVMTHPTYEALGRFYGLEPELRVETFDDVGELGTVVFYPSQMQRQFEPPTVAPGASLFGKARWRSFITYKTLIDVAGLSKDTDKFDGLPK